MLTREGFNKALKTAGVSKTGLISLSQFSLALDTLQHDLEESLAADDDSSTDEQDDWDSDEEDDERPHAADATSKKKKTSKDDVASSHFPSAADVAMSMASGNVDKVDNYDFSNALNSLDELQQRGKGKPKPVKVDAKISNSPKNVPVTPAPIPPPAAVVRAAPKSAASVSDSTTDEDDDDYEDIPEPQTEEEKARQIYDKLRGNRPSVSVADFLKWEDVVDLLDCGAVTKEQLGQALGDAKVTVDQPDKTVLSFEKVSLFAC